MDNQITNQSTQQTDQPMQTSSEEGITRIPYVTDQENPAIKEYVAAMEKGLSKDLSHDKLLPTLYFILDSFERASLDFFLIRQTAKDAIASHQLTGDHIDIGVRNNEWMSDAKDILFAYFDDEHVEKKEEVPGHITFQWKDVPFTLHFYEDNPCITALNTITYEYETWHIPNQFERFEKEFDA